MDLQENILSTFCAVVNKVTVFARELQWRPRECSFFLDGRVMENKRLWKTVRHPVIVGFGVSFVCPSPSFFFPCFILFTAKQKWLFFLQLVSV